jgi:membrane associated rhomboid family serine protease
MSTASVGFHCPECSKTGSQKVYTRATWSDALHRPVVAQVLIAVNVAVWLAGAALDNGGGGFIVDGGLFGPSVADGEWWRIVTSGFLHSTRPMHLLFNMLALWSLAGVLEPALGRLRFGVLYGFSLLAGSLGVLVLSPDSLTVGASGAVFGLMGALLVAHWARGIDPWSSGLGGVLLVNLLITFTVPRISVGGHLGGLAGGLLAAWILLDVGPKAFKQAWAPVAVVVALGGAVVAASLAVAAAA